MATIAQIEANRRNCLRSTGPKTPEGKSRSSQNAYSDEAALLSEPKTQYRHGFTAENAVSLYDDITSFWELEQSFLAQLQPVGSLELHLARTVISAAWRLQRLQNMEAGLWDLDTIDSRPDAQHYLAEDRREKLALAFRKNCESKTLPTLSLYEQRLERSFYKSLRELRQLQADRHQIEPPPSHQVTRMPSPALDTTDPHDSNSHTIQPTQSLISQIGFVSSFSNQPLDQTATQTPSRASHGTEDRLS